MKKLTLLFLFISTSIFAQTEYKVLQSETLQDSRQIKIQLPRNYNNNTEKSYPVFIVLDGDYLFEPVAGNVDYYSYWEDMPESIVVGVNEVGKRRKDTEYDKETFLPTKQGAEFFEFIGLELLPLIDKNYRTAKFAIIVGHDLTASFMNYYLLKEDPLFKGYINLSPDYAPNLKERVADALNASESKTWYYLATSTDDVESLNESNKQMNELLKTIDNEKFYYYFDNFEEATHYSLVGRGIPKAIESIFSIYRPINQKEYEDQVLTTKGTYYEYLVDKYETVSELYGLDIQVRINDFIYIADAIEISKEWDQYKDLGKLANDEHPNKMLGSYFLARYYEETGNAKKAMKEYQNAFALEEASYLTKDMMLKRIEQIKQDFGY
ncbi:alpha/beta hydrolase [Mesonia maritima]|uniref:Esterase n=1 Tax=Mesonia maritima TaxID=1793873 RepID=A0ABU1K1U5_9FLAO|nr:alpha/beta hydrolase-fold protein [Mesonia maritima]MDR6299588.1 hypothetical protein [Mesonia maritima]